MNKNNSTLGIKNLGKTLACYLKKIWFPHAHYPCCPPPPHTPVHYFLSGSLMLLPSLPIDKYNIDRV
jgi:hypothetical protein